MKIAICDDTFECICVLRDYLEEINPPDMELETYQGGENLASAYRDIGCRYDAVFLDMEMDGLNGIQTANIIRELDEHVIIVFVTSYKKYMQESFQCLPFRYLLKPVSFDEFNEVFSKICEKLAKKRRVFNFTDNKTMVRLMCDDIVYCESQGHLVWIHTKEKVYKVRKSINDLHKALDTELFVRTHKSFLINLRHIKELKENNIEMHYCNNLIPISRSYRKTVVDKFTCFIEKEYYV